MIKLKLVIVFAIIFSSCANKSLVSQNSTKVSTKYTEENQWIASIVEDAMERNNIPAVSIAVVREGAISYVDGYGKLSRESTKKVDGNSIYELASIAKTFTGIIVSNLIAEGKLNLEAPITIYLDSILSAKAKERLHTVKLKHLMAHTSGIPHRTCAIYKEYQKGPNNYTKGYTEQELIADINSIVLDFEPGEKFAYSSSGYNVAGYIAELVSGESYEELLKNYVTNRSIKYGMHNTVVYLEEAQKDRLVSAYLPNNRYQLSKVTIWGKTVPASGVFSTVRDLSKLAIMQMQAYQNYNKTGKRTPLILTDFEGMTGDHYGLGLQKFENENYTFYVHEGDNDGFRTAYLFFPDHNVALILFTSSGGPWMGAVASEIFHKLINVPFTKGK